jgi:plastocyanin
MSKLFTAIILAIFMTVSAYAHQAFTLVSSEKKTVKESEIRGLEKDQTFGKKEKSNLSFADKIIRLVVVTGPEDDMLSYWIQGVRNPTLVVPAGATLKILFVNVDVDMRHDIRFGHITGDFPIAPASAERAGSEKLEKRAEDGTLQAEEIVVKADENGVYKYFCSVRGHAKGGMWGNIAVGIKPGENLKAPEKIPHVHSADEEKEPHQHGAQEKPKSAVETNKASEKKPNEQQSQTQKQNAEHHQHTEKNAANEQQTSEMPGMAHGENHSAMKMRSVVNINDPATRESSGTAWVPESSPMFGQMKVFSNGDTLMLHGSGFLRYTSVGSSRDLSVGGKGDRSRFDAPTMFMAMYSHPFGNRAQLGLRAMVSLDPIIERGYGYPLLYQSGETYRNRPIHDRQHPHDFFSELSASFSYKISENQSVYFYAGLPGEPALGPPTFMHRASAMNNPDAPLGHHWQDASHVTFGVITAGYSFDKFKFEASVFKGREPDENRWNIDSPRLDSFSGRLTFNPNKEWSFQISHGYLKNPEPSEPDLKILRRTTASAIYNKSFRNDKNWANSFVWGQNHSDDGRTNSFLYETDFQFQKNSVFGRFERVQKNEHELVLPHPHPEGNFWVGLLSAGYVRDVIKDKGLDVGVGAQATWYTNPAELTPFYGGTNHGGFQVFVRFRPSKMRH